MAAVVFADAGPLVALLDRREEHHSWASSHAARIGWQVRTCGAVLTETCFLLSAQPPAIARLRALVNRGALLSVGEDSTLWSRALALMERYANVPMSFADACLVALAEATPEARIFTLDRDFLIYRQHADRPLALLAPFAE